MGKQGLFGYKIGRKTRMILVENDADLLWQILVREIYILTQHYGSIDNLKTKFENIIEVKSRKPPKPEQIEKLKIFANHDTDTTQTHEPLNKWQILLRYCQSSYINILEAGYILNEQERTNGYIFLLDFNENCVKFTYKQQNNERQNNNLTTKEINSAKIEEIMEFDDMPTNSLSEILIEMYNNYQTYNNELTEVRTEIEKIRNIIESAKRQCAANIEDKAKQLLSEKIWEEKQLHMNRRVFFRRLKALDMIEDE